MMRFLFVLAALATCLLASPSFWMLVSMHTGAQAVTYHHRDGSRQEALLGPKAPWPDWAVKPEGAKLSVRSWFGPSVQATSSGQGDLEFPDPTSATATRYKAMLRDDGWSVEASRIRLPLPEIPPQTLETCRIIAHRGARALLVTLDFAPSAGHGTMFWLDGPPPASWARQVPTMGDC
jgi:hypothetical protein